MLTLPLPLIAALLLALWLVRGALAGDRSALLLAAVGIAALQAALIALVQHYGVTALRWAQPIGAMLVPAALWIAFDAQTRDHDDALRPRRALHGAGPLAAIAALLAAPSLLDPLIPLSFAGYGAALLWETRRRGRVLPRARLQHGDLPRFLWRVIAAALLASAVGDALIALDYARTGGANHGVIVSVFSALTLLALGLCALSDALVSDDAAAPGAQPAPPAAGDPAADSPAEAADHHSVFAALDAAMQASRLYLDPDLTLGKLARRTGFPAKLISAAVNRVAQENTSRYVNGYRIRHAKALLENGASVTDAMLQSGFNTKSNFNREFRRVTGAPPSAFRTG